MLICPREVQKKISPSFFSCLGGLSWHLHALHCTVLLSAFRSSVTVDVERRIHDNARFARITSRTQKVYRLLIIIRRLKSGTAKTVPAVPAVPALPYFLLDQITTA